jgi:two-component system response regulator YesN
MSEPYRALIVDDEPIIIESLGVAIPWDEWNVEIVGGARNGFEALELIRAHRPQLILTDVRMPGMNGIDLMREAAPCYAEGEHPAFIVLSGYAEFDYARQAIQCGARGYLLKPIDHEELGRLVASLVEELDRARFRRQRDSVLKRRLDELSQIAREHLIALRIHGEMSGPPAPVDVPELDESYRLYLVAMDNHARMRKEWSPKDRRLWYYAVDNVLREWTRDNGGFVAFSHQEGEWVALFPGDDPETAAARGRDMIDKLDRLLHLSCSVGISAPHATIGRLPDAYRSARRAMMERLYHGRKQVLLDREGTQDEPGRPDAVAVRVGKAYPHHLEKRLLHGLQTLDMKALDEALAALSAELRASPSAETVNRVLRELSIVVSRYAEEVLGLGEDAAWPDLTERVEECDTLEEKVETIRAYVTAKCREWTESAPSREREHERLIAGAIRYMQEHYRRDLGLEEVSDAVGLSYSHFSMLFREKTGMTFLEYLTRLRMEKACDLLRNTRMKVYQIAPMVGYQEPKYFMQVFKRTVGMTPSEYRAQHPR